MAKLSLKKKLELSDRICVACLSPHTFFENVVKALNSLQTSQRYSRFKLFSNESTVLKKINRYLSKLFLWLKLVSKV